MIQNNSNHSHKSKPISHHQNQQQQTIQLHQTKFSKSIPQSSIKKFQQFANDPSWDISQNYKTIDAQQIFINMRQTNVTYLFIGQNQISNIIQDIRHIKFKNLKILGLAQNRICNIQILAMMDLPVLQGINLVDNCIVSIKPLYKLLSNKIFVLSLQDNFITDLSPITDMICHRQFRQIGINFMIQTLCCDHIGWFMKMGCDNLRKLWIGQYDRIIVKSIGDVFKRKFVNGEIVSCRRN